VIAIRVYGDVLQLAWFLAELLRLCADRLDYHDTFVAFAVLVAESPGISASGKSFHAFVTCFLQLISLVCATTNGDGLLHETNCSSNMDVLATVAKSSLLPPHFRLFYTIALVSAASAYEANGHLIDGAFARNQRRLQEKAASNRESRDPLCVRPEREDTASTPSVASDTVKTAVADHVRASSAGFQLLCDIMHDIFADTCGHVCMHADVLSDLLVETCMAGSSSGYSATLSRSLLKYSHRQLLSSHCHGVSKQRLELAAVGQPVVLGRTAGREMFVARLRLPSDDTHATQTDVTPSGWWLKVERSCASIHTYNNDTTYSIFLNNKNASQKSQMQASFEIGVLANTDQAMRKAEAAAVLIEHSGFMRPGLWAPHEAAIHRSAIRQEFSGTAWGIRHLFNDMSLARFGFAGHDYVCVFAMVQTS
jgi:hypothetical protein